MDAIDRKILNIIQQSGRKSCAEIANTVKVSVSTVNERIRKLERAEKITAWRAILDPKQVGLDLCAFIFLDMAHEHEQENCNKLAALPEVQELHHISGEHSYLLKVRVADTSALQQLLQQYIKPLCGPGGTTSMVVLSTEKETSEMMVS